MTNHFLFDSFFRDRVKYPSALEYTYLNKTWKTTRDVNSVRNKYNGSSDQYTIMKLMHLILPITYDDVDGVGLQTQDQPYWLVEISNREASTKSTQLINGTYSQVQNSSAVNKATFVVFFDRLQLDAGGNAQFVVYKPHTEQLLIFDAGKPVSIKIMDRSNQAADTGDNPSGQEPNPLVQTVAYFTTAPYERSNEYSNHKLLYSPKS